MVFIKEVIKMSDILSEKNVKIKVRESVLFIKEKNYISFLSSIINIFPQNMQYIINNLKENINYANQKRILSEPLDEDSFKNLFFDFQNVFDKSIIYAFKNASNNDFNHSSLSKRTWNNIAKNTINKMADQDSANYGIKFYIQIIRRIFLKCKIITIGIENQYVDKIYRDSFYYHYSEEHFNRPRFCKRVVLFAGQQQLKITSKDFNLKELNKHFIGSIVIKPFENRTIGRSLLNPYYFCISGTYVRTTRYKINYMGIPLEVDAFPFEMQDKVTTTCAEITLINLFDYYSNQFADYRFVVPSHLHNIIKVQNYDRVKPSCGLSFTKMSKILYDEGFSTKYYHRNSYNSTTFDMSAILPFYIESGIPVALGIKLNDNDPLGHAIVCIGHGKCSIEKLKNTISMKSSNDKLELNNSSAIHRFYSFNAINSLIVQDDLKMPYNEVEYDPKSMSITYTEGNGNKENFLIDCMIIPLYKRMYMDSRLAMKTVDMILLNDDFRRFGYAPLTKYETTGLQDDNPIIVRLFLATSWNLRQHRIFKIDNEVMSFLYQQVPMPHFIWVAELYTLDGYASKKAFGEIILDATDAREDFSDNIIMINYPNYHLARGVDGNSMFIGKGSNTPLAFVYNSTKCFYPTYEDHNLTNVDNFLHM